MSKCGGVLVMQPAATLCATLEFLPHFVTNSDLLLNRSTATWNLFVKTFTPAILTQIPLYVFYAVL